MAEAVKFYHVISTSRSIRTRTVRAQNATHSGLKQFIGGTHRLIRKRPLVLSEAEVMKYLKELREKQAIGMLEVQTPDGRLVDLITFKVAPTPVTPPKPKPPLDSIANDDAWGEKMENVPAGKPMQDAMEELEKKELAKAAEEEVTADTEPPPPSEPAQELAEVPDEPEAEEEVDEVEEEVDEVEEEVETSTKRPAKRQRGRRTAKRNSR